MGKAASARTPTPPKAPPPVPYPSADAPSRPITGFRIGWYTPATKFAPGAPPPRSARARPAPYGCQRGGWPIETMGAGGVEGVATCAPAGVAPRIARAAPAIVGSGGKRDRMDRLNGGQ